MTERPSSGEERLRRQRIEEILRGASGLSPDEREAYLDRECADDSELRAAVDSLLQADSDSDSDSRSERPSRGAMETVTRTDASIPGPQSGDRIDNYRLIRSLGEGGMGEVFEAQQEQPVRRRVALKVIKLGMDTRRVITRFEAERQALAMMEHPNIARALDAGATARGRPYFVMEFVAGAPITDYCDEQRLTTRERLELFEQVCAGVQHAHQKAIIHRDLKPSNVLVMESDGNRVPKIIDFGVAKAIDHRLTEKTLFTEHGALIGTPAYMSPEQAGLSNTDVDTRTDVYSLGVLLYQLLVGALPFDPKELRTAAFEEIRRRIREDEPSRPSTRLSSLGEMATESARNRRVDFSTLQRQLEGDLDWITMRALEKDRVRRYGSPTELAADIRRYLSDEPVLATPPSAGYRMRKFVKRHRFGVLTAAAAAVLLLGTAAALAVQNHRIATERDRANLERQVSERISQALEEVLGDVDPAVMGGALWADLRQRVESTQRARGLSEQEADVVLAGFEEALADVNPTDVTLRLMDEQVLEPAGDSMKETLADDPRVAGRLETALAASYRRLGMLDRAETHAVLAVRLTEERLGPDHAEFFAAQVDLAQIHTEQRRLDEAEPLLSNAIEGLRELFGDRHREVARATNALGRIRQSQGRYDEAESLALDALEALRQTLGPTHNETLWSLSNLIRIYKGQARYDDAEPLARELLDLRTRSFGDEHPATLWAAHHLSHLLNLKGQYAEAESIAVVTLEARRRLLGDDHPDTLWSIVLMGHLSQSLGRAEESVALRGEALERRRRVLGQVHPDTIGAMNDLANTYWWQDRYSEAEPLYRNALEIRRRTLGPTHPDTLSSMNNLALVYSRLGRRNDAENMYVEVVEGNSTALGAVHPTTLNAKLNLAILYRSRQRFEQAEPLMQEVLEGRAELLGADHPDTLGAAANLGGVYRMQGRHDEAVQIGEQVLERSRKKLGADHPASYAHMSQLIRAYREQGDLAKAEALCVEKLAAAERKFGEGTTSAVVWHSALADLRRRQGALNEAEEILTGNLERAQELNNRGTTAWVLYCLSCLHAARGERREALDRLQQAVDHGFTNSGDLRAIVHDPDLGALRGDPRFDGLVAEIRRRVVGDGG